MEADDAETKLLAEESSLLEPATLSQHLAAKLTAVCEAAFEDLKEHVSLSSGALTLDLLELKRCSPQQAVSGIHRFFENSCSANRQQQQQQTQQQQQQQTSTANVRAEQHFLQLLGSQGKIAMPYLLLLNQNGTGNRASWSNSSASNAAASSLAPAASSTSASLPATAAAGKEGHTGELPSTGQLGSIVHSPLTTKQSQAVGSSGNFSKLTTSTAGSVCNSISSISIPRSHQPSHSTASTLSGGIPLVAQNAKPPAVTTDSQNAQSLPSEAALANTREQIVEQAKQEAYVMQRIAELRKKGMWSLRRLPKVAEPLRTRAHWDYLLEEMQWLAADFVQERKWKRNSAAKCSKMMMKYHSLQGEQAQRREKEEQVKVRRIASSIAQMVSTFWSDIEQLVAHKQEVQMQEKRKKIHDMQLRSFIGDKAASLKNSRAPSVDSADQMLFEELELPQARKTNRMVNELKRKELEHDADSESSGSSCADDDDEETIAKEEDQEANEPMDHKVELNELESDAKVPIEELLARYGVDIEMPMSTEQTKYTTAQEETEMDETDSEETSDDDESIDMAAYSDNHIGDDDDSRREMTEADAAAAAERIQPKGNTLSSVEVTTKVPFLLKCQLREYQHIGLNWLTAMYEANLNGILADEMGLGKTIQTISLIAHLACEKGIWGPHLIVVPTSVMLNWEMEFKKWCPSLKVLTYYGSPKERQRLKRKGWTKQNTFHVCITSYKLVAQDQASFRRKKWVYLILDEAQHIKNFKSQRWQMLLNFNSSRRLLLTGTPLPSNLMELCSLVHFLLPNVLLQSGRELKDRLEFNPVTGTIEGGNQENDEIIGRLHNILRPFCLRRLKVDVEKQLPKKYEHTVTCSLSKRQRQLYEQYMGKEDTQEALASGNFLSVINTLMQLRKVCNHPNLVEPRPTISPFIDSQIVLSGSSLVNSVLDYQPHTHIDLSTLNLIFTQLSTELSKLDHRTIECSQADDLRQLEGLFKGEPQAKVYARVSSLDGFNHWLRHSLRSSLQEVKSVSSTQRPSLYRPYQPMNQAVHNVEVKLELEADLSSVKLIKQCEGTTLGGEKETATARRGKLRTMISVNKRRCSLSPLYSQDCISALNLRSETSVLISSCSGGGQSSSLFSLGNGFSQCLLAQTSTLNPEESSNALSEMLYTPSSLEASLRPILARFLCIVPSVLASPAKLSITHLPSYKKIDDHNFSKDLSRQLPADFFDVTALPRIQLRFQLPELRLIQHDCGKLQTLDHLLWKLKAGNHRVLIFTQMSRMLDIFEQFLSYRRHTYLRLDGSTKIEQRQALMERFNADQRIFCCILSTRSGRVGLNLTGAADTVIFYDSDWNPTMDAQAQERCHRIGQTRDVHIYRLVSESTVEENILRKAQQKSSLLGDLVAIEEGNFTTAFFKQAAIQELFEIDNNKEPDDSFISSSLPAANTQSSSGYQSAFEQALCIAEEEEADAAAARQVAAEAAAELVEFDEEAVPIQDETFVATKVRTSPEERQIERAISQLLPIERFALQYVESQPHLPAPLKEETLEFSKRQLQKDIRKWRQQHQQEERQAGAELLADCMLTCAREDASLEKVFSADNSGETMPVWAPPTPPQEQSEFYVDHSLGFLYESTLMPESQLPPVYVPKEHKRFRPELQLQHARKQAAAAGLQAAGAAGGLAHPLSHGTAGSSGSGALTAAATTKASSSSYKKVSEDFFQNMKSIFYRPNTSLIRLRKDQLAAKVKLWPGTADLVSTFQRCLNAQNSQSFNFQQSSISLGGGGDSKGSKAASSALSLTPSPRWTQREDLAIISSLLYLQELPCNLSVIYPGLTPNWDFVAEQVNTYNTLIVRPELACRHRYESIISPKHDGISGAASLEHAPFGGGGEGKTALHSHILSGSSAATTTTTSAKQSKSTKKSKSQAAAAAANQTTLQQGPAGLFLSYPAMSSQSITLNPSGKGPLAVNSQQVAGGAPGGTSASSKVPPALAANASATHSMAMHRVAKHLATVIADQHSDYVSEMHRRFEAIRRIVVAKTQTSKARFSMQPGSNNKRLYDHNASLASNYGINYGQPKSAEELAAVRQERINREHLAKQKQALVKEHQSKVAAAAAAAAAQASGSGTPLHLPGMHQFHAGGVGGGGGGVSPSTPAMMVVPGSPAAHQQLHLPQPQFQQQTAQQQQLQQQLNQQLQQNQQQLQQQQQQQQPPAQKVHIINPGAIQLVQPNQQQNQQTVGLSSLQSSQQQQGLLTTTATTSSSQQKGGQQQHILNSGGNVGSSMINQQQRSATVVPTAVPASIVPVQLQPVLAGSPSMVATASGAAASGLQVPPSSLAVQQPQPQQATIRTTTSNQQLVGTVQGRQFQLHNIRQTNNPQQRLQIKLIASTAQQVGGNGGGGGSGQTTLSNSIVSTGFAAGSGGGGGGGAAAGNPQKGHIIISSNQLVSAAGAGGQAGSVGGVTSASSSGHVIPPSVLQQVVSRSGGGNSGQSGGNQQALTFSICLPNATEQAQQQQQMSMASSSQSGGHQLTIKAPTVSSSSSSSPATINSSINTQQQQLQQHQPTQKVHIINPGAIQLLHQQQQQQNQQTVGLSSLQSSQQPQQQQGLLTTTTSSQQKGQQQQHILNSSGISSAINTSNRTVATVVSAPTGGTNILPVQLQSVQHSGSSSPNVSTSSVVGAGQQKQQQLQGQPQPQQAVIRTTTTNQQLVGTVQGRQFQLHNIRQTNNPQQRLQIKLITSGQQLAGQTTLSNSTVANSAGGFAQATGGGGGGGGNQKGHIIISSNQLMAGQAQGSASSSGQVIPPSVLQQVVSRSGNTGQSLGGTSGGGNQQALTFSICLPNATEQQQQQQMSMASGSQSGGHQLTIKAPTVSSSSSSPATINSSSHQQHSSALVAALSSQSTPPRSVMAASGGSSSNPIMLLATQTSSSGGSPAVSGHQQHTPSALVAALSSQATPSRSSKTQPAAFASMSTTSTSTPGSNVSPAATLVRPLTASTTVAANAAAGTAPIVLLQTQGIHSGIHRQQQQQQATEQSSSKLAPSTPMDTSD